MRARLIDLAGIVALIAFYALVIRWIFSPVH